jgi:hypothetical protein
MTEFDCDRIRAVIARLSFRVAKTMPEIGHEYTVRSPETEADFVALFNAIQQHGIYERWKVTYVENCWLLLGSSGRTRSGRRLDSPSSGSTGNNCLEANS